MTPIFCSGLRCARANTCSLYIGNDDVPRPGEQIAIAQYADHDGRCSKYSALPYSGPACVFHHWVTRKSGGHPADPESHQRITRCSICGTHREESSLENA